jgi:hypothetical protein
LNASKSIVATSFLAGSAGIVAWALVASGNFGDTSKAHPFLMGFLKLFFLGTLGELLKFRIVRGTWGLDKTLQRAGVWGLFGFWFALSFRGFSELTEGLVKSGLWPSTIPFVSEGLWMAFSKSLWINLLGMFGLGMMVAHEYFNHLIRNGWRTWSLVSFARQADAGFLLAFLPKTLLFWIPAHTFTFAMPGEWRVFIAAILAIALGFLLSVGRRAEAAGVVEAHGA